MTDNYDNDLEDPASALVDDPLEGALETDDPLNETVDDLLNDPFE